MDLDPEQEWEWGWVWVAREEWVDQEELGWADQELGWVDRRGWARLGYLRHKGREEDKDRDRDRDSSSCKEERGHRRIRR